MIANICVHASPQRSKPIAIIVPVEAALAFLAQKHEIAGSHDELVQNEKLRGIVLAQVQQSGRKGGLIGIEIVEGVVLSEEEWNPANVSFSLFFSFWFFAEEEGEKGEWSGFGRD